MEGLLPWSFELNIGMTWCFSHIQTATIVNATDYQMSFHFPRRFPFLRLSCSFSWSSILAAESNTISDAVVLAEVTHDLLEWTESG